MKSKTKQTINDSSDNNMCQTFNVEEEYKEKAIKDSSTLLSSTKGNYVDCNFKSLVTIKCGNISCTN